MRFHKLVKSFDYVTYPVLVELRKINRTLGNSLSNLNNIFLSAAIGLLFDITPLSSIIVDKWLKPCKWSFVSNFAQYSEIDTLVAFSIAGLFLFFLWVRDYLNLRFGSNKDTVDERNLLVHEFYRVVIPSLISAKSFIKQHDDTDKNDVEKRFLLLLQAKHELEELICILSDMRIIEVDSKTHILSEDSKNVLAQIGDDIYFTILLDMIKCTLDVYSKIRVSGKSISALDSLKTQFLAANVFTDCARLVNHNALCTSVNTLYTVAKSQISTQPT